MVKGKRKDRLAQFMDVKSGSTVTLSGDLLSCAHHEFHNALVDRKKDVFKTEDNHYSHHSISSILLLIAGFEAWLNELIALLAGSDTTKRGVAELDIRKKYYKIPNAFCNKTISYNQELYLLIEIRNEIAHYLPRVLKKNIPKWFNELDKMELFIKSEKPIDFLFPSKLSSYKLVYWSWSVIFQACTNLLNELQDYPLPKSLSNSLGNFKFDDMINPDDLKTFDKHHNIELTKP